MRLVLWAGAVAAARATEAPGGAALEAGPGFQAATEAPGGAALEAGPGFQAAIQGVVDFLSDYYNTSFSLTFHGPRAVYSAVAGVEDRKTGAPLARDAPIPLGSATKPFTAAAVLRLADRGLLRLDDAAGPYVDKWLGNASLAGLYGPRAANVTLRMLLSMRSGMPDYDDALYRKRTFAGGDYLPAAVVGDAPHDLACDPGTCGVYSSVGYILLGFALATATNATDWRDVDQKGLAYGDAPAPGDVVFPGEGPCTTTIPGVPRQYSTRVLNDSSFGFFDVSGDSCLNAWTAGNVAATTRALADFWKQLFDGKVLPTTDLETMAAFLPLTQGWGAGLEYGAGLMAQAWPTVNGSYATGLAVWGHGGEDYGSETTLNGYVPFLNASVVLAKTSYDGTNCSLSLAENRFAKDFAACFAYDRVLHAINPRFPRLACRTVADSDGADDDDAGAACLGTLDP